jgi:hypothetical protein
MRSSRWGCFSSVSGDVTLLGGGGGVAKLAPRNKQRIWMLARLKYRICCELCKEDRKIEDEN